MLILALTYVADPATVLREMARVLKPAAGKAKAGRDDAAAPRRAIIVDLLPHDRDDFRRQLGQTRLGFDPKELSQLLLEAGFTSPRIVPLPPEPAAKGPALFLATGERAGE